MTRATTLLAVVALTGSAFAADWYDPAWEHRRTVTIQEGFFVIGDDQADFPVLIELKDEPASLFEKARADGADILFTAEDGVTKLPHEIECFSKGDAPEKKGGSAPTTRPAARDHKPGKILRCWVRLPKLMAIEDTRIYLYYGNPKARPRAEPAKVWSDDFAAVWHLSGGGRKEEKVSLPDSSPNANHAEAPSEDTAFPDGKVGAALDGRASAPYSESLALTSKTPFTLSFWARWSWHPDQTINLIGGYAWRVYWHDTSRWQFLMVDDPRSRGNILVAYQADREPHGRWRHIAAVYEPEPRRVRLYIDGVMRTERSVDEMKALTSKRALPFGVKPLSRTRHCLMDEVRVSRTVRSADWIAACYKNQMYPDKRIRVGPERARPKARTEE